MKRLMMIALASAVFGAAGLPVYANDAHHPKAEAQKSYGVKGEVLVLDKAAGKVELKHEAVPELGWPGMTMFFPVADKSQLDGLKVGDQVDFQFVQADGGPLIIRIKPVK